MKYKKLAKAEKNEKTIKGNPLSHSDFSAIYGSLWILMGIMFVVKGIVGIIWRVLH